MLHIMRCNTVVWPRTCTCILWTVCSAPAVEKTPLLHEIPPGTVVLQQPVAQPPKFKEFPVDVVDERGNRFTTEVRYVNGLLTWIAVGITCLVAGTLLYHL